MTSLGVAGVVAGVAALVWAAVALRRSARRVERPLALRRERYEEAGWRFRIRFRPRRRHCWMVTARLPVAGARHIVVHTEATERRRAWEVALNGIRRDEVDRHVVARLRPRIGPAAVTRRVS